MTPPDDRRTTANRPPPAFPFDVLSDHGPPQCRNCGELVFDLAAGDQMSVAQCRKLHLLLPDEVRERRPALGLTPEELSRRLGFPPDTVERIEGGIPDPRLGLESGAVPRAEAVA